MQETNPVPAPRRDSTRLRVEKVVDDMEFKRRHDRNHRIRSADAGYQVANIDKRNNGLPVGGGGHHAVSGWGLDHWRFRVL